MNSSIVSLTGLQCFFTISSIKNVMNRRVNSSFVMRDSVCDIQKSLTSALKRLALAVVDLGVSEGLCGEGTPEIVAHFNDSIVEDGDVLYFLSADLSVNGILPPFKSLSRTRRYYGTGEFELCYSDGDGSPPDGAVYVYSPLYGDTALIDSVSASLSEEGERLCVLRGRSLEAVLASRVISGEETYSGGVEACARYLAGKYAAGSGGIPRLELGGLAGIQGEITFSSIGDNLCERLFSLLAPFQASFRVRCDFDNAALIFEVWQGNDRTSAQNVNGLAVFSDSFGNVAACAYDRSLYPYNRVYVDAYDGGAVYDLSTSLSDRRELYIFASKLRQGELSASAYQALLEDYAKERLAAVNKKPSLELTFNTASHPCCREGFDLGDLCELELPSVSLSANARLTELRERRSEKGYSLNGGFTL